MTVDRIFLGTYSTEALAAAMGSLGLFWAPMALIQQTAAYVTTFVAQYLGQRQDEWVGPCVWQALYVSVLGGLLFLLLVPATPTLFAWIGHSASLQVLEVQYFQMLCWSAMPTALIAAVCGFFTGLGRSRVIILINLCGVVANIVFDYLLIFGHAGFPEMGIAGAGLATALANLVATLLGLSLVFRKEYRQRFLLLQSWRWRGELFGRFLKFGIPSGLQWALEGLAFTAFHVFIGRMPNGEVALAASGVAITIMMLALLPSLGVAQGLSALVGQSLGEGNPQQARTMTGIALKLCLVYAGVMGLSFVFVPDFYLGFFANAENQQRWREVEVIVPWLLILVTLALAFDTTNLIFSFTLKGAGDTRFVSLVALTIPWPVMVLPSWWVVNRLDGVYWAWVAATVYIVLQAIIFIFRFRGGRWQSMRVT